MLTVLWLMTVASVVALAGGLAGRNGVNGARNRIQMERAFWVAMGCARRAHAGIDELLARAPTFQDASLRWRTLDRQLAQSAILTPAACDVTMEAAGTRLDLNRASDDAVGRLLRALGHGSESVEMVDALADWRDTDHVARPLGAESDWYAAVRRFEPRNANMADVRELSRVRGFEELERYETVATTEPGRVSLATAPVTVLLAVPGFTRESAERIVALRDDGTPLRDLLQLPGMLSPSSREELLAHYSEIVRMTTVDPDAWILTSRATSGFPSSTVAVEWRILRSARRAAIARMRVIQ
jgi:type II secretory pathway component PulK